MRSIDLLSFLCNYYGIVSDNLKINKLTHNDMKVLFPFIKRCSYEKVENEINKVYKGEIILVHDSKGHILPYINPFLKIGSCFLEYDSLLEKEKIDIIDYELNNLSKEELLKLRRNLKKNNQYFEQKKVTEAIRGKKDPKIKKYKREKMYLKMEESYEKN